MPMTTRPLAYVLSTTSCKLAFAAYGAVAAQCQLCKRLSAWNHTSGLSPDASSRLPPCMERTTRRGTPEATPLADESPLLRHCKLLYLRLCGKGLRKSSAATALIAMQAQSSGLTSWRLTLPSTVVSRLQKHGTQMYHSRWISFFLAWEDGGSRSNFLASTATLPSAEAAEALECFAGLVSIASLLASHLVLRRQGIETVTAPSSALESRQWI